MTSLDRYSLLHVTRVTQVTPRMARITFGGADLAHFTSVAPDQQVKLFFAKPGQGRPEVPTPAGDVARWYQSYLAVPEERRPWMRSYSVRAHHPRRAEVDIDFVLHPHGGPASRWAESAGVGDVVGMIGPATSRFRDICEHDCKLLVGDETALPAIGAFADSLGPGERAVVYVEVADAAEEQRLPSRGDLTVHWVHRDDGAAGHGDLLVRALTGATLPAGALFVWLAGEATAVRTLRRHLVEDRGIPKSSIAFTGYWRRDLTQDEPPTEAEFEDARLQTEV